jgi:hypothetical protein
VSTDLDFSRKAADVMGLYLNPLENALVLSVWTKSPAFKLWSGPRLDPLAQWPGADRLSS